MTTIATDGRVIAADGRFTWGDEIISEDMEKIVHSGPHVYGFTGTTIMMRPAIDWFEKGGDPETVPGKGNDKMDWTLLVITAEQAFILSNDGPYPMPVVFPFAMGKGGEAAAAVMAAGLSPLEAVQAVAKRFTHTGGAIRTIDIALALGKAPLTPVTAAAALTEMAGRMVDAEAPVIDRLVPRRA